MTVTYGETSIDVHLGDFIRFGEIIFRIIKNTAGGVLCEPMLWNYDDPAALHPYGIRNPNIDRATLTHKLIVETLFEQRNRKVIS